MDQMTLENKVSYVDFLWRPIIEDYEKYFFRPKPLIPTLYHYTNLEGLYGILQSNSLWASNINFINDSSEYEYGIALFEDVARHIKGDLKSSRLRDVLENISEMLKIGKENTYCASFCENKDLLSQWRGYSNGNVGIAIGFENTHYSALNCYYEGKLVSGIDSKPCKVIYGYEEGFKCIEGLFHKMDDFLANNEEIKFIKDYEPVQSIVFSLNEIVPLFKDKAFVEEDEWRVAICMNDYHIHRLHDNTKFRPRGNVLLPYICLRASILDAIKKKQTTGEFNSYEEVVDQFSLEPILPVREIVIGPSSNQELTAESIKLHNKVKEIDDIVVSYSTIPFRE